jgi:hypothetical protein
MELSPRQRARLRLLLEEELRAALSTAREQAFSSAAIDAALVNRARLLDELLHATGQPDEPADRDGEGDGAGGQY